jgi:large subunit ribosomal protein L12
MEYIYAVMLLTKAGKQITEASVSAVLSAAGVAVDATKVKSLLAALEGVDVEKVISEVSFAGGAAAPAASGAAPAAAAPAAEKKKEEASFDAAAGLGSLF